MIIDSSALVAILRDEPESRAFAIAIRNADRRLLSAPTYLETAMVIGGRKAEAGTADLDALIAETRVAIVPFSAAASRVACHAFFKYGKGRHPAGLNFGDCISYTLAKTELMPLLFKGDNFRMTDVEAVV